MHEHDDIYHNRAALDAEANVQDCTSFACCHEELVFAMRDQHHDFSLALSTVLECLAIAEKDGFVPALPDGWWIDLRHY